MGRWLGEGLRPPPFASLRRADEQPHTGLGGLLRATGASHLAVRLTNVHQGVGLDVLPVRANDLGGQHAVYRVVPRRGAIGHFFTLGEEEVVGDLHGLAGGHDGHAGDENRLHPRPLRTVGTAAVVAELRDGLGACSRDASRRRCQSQGDFHVPYTIGSRLCFATPDARFLYR